MSSFPIINREITENDSETYKLTNTSTRTVNLKCASFIRQIEFASGDIFFVTRKGRDRGMEMRISVTRHRFKFNQKGQKNTSPEQTTFCITRIERSLFTYICFKTYAWSKQIFLVSDIYAYSLALYIIIYTFYWKDVFRYLIFHSAAF